MNIESVKVEGICMHDDILTDHILAEIAAHFPFSFESLKRIWNEFRSYDLLIITCEYCNVRGISDMQLLSSAFYVNKTLQFRYKAEKDIINGQ